MRCKGLIVAALMLATPLCAMAERGIVSNSKDVTFSTISPQDGSLWIATESHGLIRLGSTGRTFHYSSATGDFPCDSIAALAFSANGTLYMKDARGDVYSYTTISGFKLQQEVPGDVLFEAQAKDNNDSNPVQDLPTPYRNHPTWPFWLVIIILCGVIFYLVLPIFLSTRTKESKAPLEVGDKESQKVEELPVKPAVKPSEPAQAPSEEPQIIPNPGFVARVEELVAANFTDPGYSVETLADALGITRVHLNRKLKEAGAPAPKMILKKARMEKALTMLREGLPVSDVYAACGFSSASYFSSAFKEYFGYTPSDVTKPNI